MFKTKTIKNLKASFMIAIGSLLATPLVMSSANAGIIGSILVDSVDTAELTKEDNIYIKLKFTFPEACRNKIRLVPNRGHLMPAYLLSKLINYAELPLSQFNPFIPEILCSEDYNKYKYMTNYLYQEGIHRISENRDRPMPPHVYFYSDLYDISENKLTYLLYIEDQYECFKAHSEDSRRSQELTFNVKRDLINTYINPEYRTTFSNNFDSGKLSIDVILSYKDPADRYEIGTKSFFNFTKKPNPKERVDESWKDYCVN